MSQEKNNQLIQLQDKSIIVADTGDIESIKIYKPQDATTNPSLIYKAAQLDIYKPLVEESIVWAQQQTKQEDSVWRLAGERLGVLIGSQITKLVPGVVSTEIDARLSFDTQASIEKAKNIIDAYEALGISRDKILIKIAATWQGINAARELELLGIRCNLTLIFNLAQARACAEAKVYLISPFVGRISDWHKAQGQSFEAATDPGVLSVKTIYAFYKHYDVETIVMAASFRSKAQILELTGCDRLTVSPNLLNELQSTNEAIERDISQLESAQLDTLKKYKSVAVSQPEFLWQMNLDAMAHEKLADGIRRFASDNIELENLLRNYK